MHTRRVAALLVVLVFGLLSAGSVSARQAQGPVVRGVLFFSPTCQHCEYVIQEVLPPLFEEHGGPWQLVYDEALTETGLAFFMLTNGTLELLLVDVTVPAGADFFATTTEALVIGSNGVPRLVVSNQVMIGSSEIPERFPLLIDAGLAESGIDWPTVPGLPAIVAALPTTDASPPTVPSSSTTAATDVASPSSVPDSTVDRSSTDATLPISSSETLGERFGRDPVANSIAVVVLLGLLLSLGGAAVLARRVRIGYSLTGLIPLLVVAGTVIATYLTSVEMTGSEAVCGPVGDCNVVQQSEYARVAGIPIGVIGLVGYLAIGALWVVQRRGSRRRAHLARVGMGVITVAGVAFSAWLTFLEPFVIGATCAWCLGSAIVITGLLWASLPGAVEAWRRLAPISAPEELAT